MYSGLEGGNVLFAHVHIGQMGTTGGVMFFLCGGAVNLRARIARQRSQEP